MCLACLACCTCLTCLTCAILILVAGSIVAVVASAFAGLVIGALAFGAGDWPWASAGPAIRLSAIAAAVNVLNMVVVLLIVRVAVTRVCIRPTGLVPIVERTLRAHL